MNTGRGQGSTLGRTSSSVMSGGGEAPSVGSPSQVLTEIWNGSTWTELNDLSTSRFGNSGGGGSTISGLAFGGSPSPGGATEEFTAGLANKTITSS